PPVDQPEHEHRAERQEDVGGVELVPESARVAAGHLPRDLVAGPRLDHPAVAGVDEDQRHLLVAGEPGDLPPAVDLAGGVRQSPVLLSLFDHVGVASGYPRRFRRSDPGARRGRKEQREDEEEDRESRAGAHEPRPKCPRTIGATSRRAHCRRSSARPGPQPTKSSGPSESPACSEPWLPPPAWLTPPQSTAS